MNRRRGQSLGWHCYYLQCCDAVSWASGRASGLLKIDEVLAPGCLKQGASDLYMVQLMPLPHHHLLLQHNPD